MGNYRLELNTIQTWIKEAANINSIRLNSGKTKAARPIILFEPPGRGKDRELTRYKYVNGITQYCRLFANDLDEALEIQENLITDIEDRDSYLDIENSNGDIVGKLKNVEVEFTDSDGLDISFVIRYEVTYSRPVPDAPPSPTFVGNRLIVNENRGEVKDY